MSVTEKEEQVCAYSQHGGNQRTVARGEHTGNDARVVDCGDS